MLPRLSEAVRHLAQEARYALRIAPVEVALAIAVAVFFSVSIESESSALEEEWGKFFLAVFLVWPATFVFTTLHQLGTLSVKWRWSLTVVALGGGALYWRFVLQPHHEAELWRWAVLAVGLALVVCLIPVAFKQEGRPARAFLWWFNLRLVVRTGLVGGYCLVLFGGLAGALAAVDNLFEMSFDDKIYAHLLGAIGFALFPWLVAAGVPWLVELKDRPMAMPRPERLLRGLAYLLVPLAVVYIAILLAYNVRVVVTGEAPKNLLSPLALGAGGIGLMATLALEPFREDKDYPLIAGFIRFFPLPFLFLVPLAGWAIWVRIEEYGVTEFRYLRLLGLAAVALICLFKLQQLVRKRPSSLSVIPSVLALACLFASTGPWGVVSCSKRSQLGRLRAALEEAGFPSAEPIDFREEAAQSREHKEVPGRLYEAITSGATYLVDHHGSQVLIALAHPDSEPPSQSDGFAGLLKLRRRPGDCDVEWIYASYPTEQPLVGFRGGTLYYVNAQLPDSGVCCGGRYRLELEGNRLEVISISDETMASVYFDEIITRLVRDRCESMGRVLLLPEETLLPLTGSDGEPKGQFFLMHANLHYTGDLEDETAEEGDWIPELIGGFLIAPE
jgi:hypothetical protein